MGSYLTVAKWIEELQIMVEEGIEPEKAGKKLKFLTEWAILALRLEELMPGSMIDGVTITKVIVKEDLKSQRRAMMVVTGVRKKEKVVTFHSGRLTADLFKTFIDRGRAKKLSWKIDTPMEREVSGEEESHLPTLDGL